MKTLKVTDEQYAFIQHLREEISEQVVGEYGFVRERDAVQFLIDNLDDDIEVDQRLESSATDDVSASVKAAVSGEPDPNELEGVESVTYDGSGDEISEDSSETVTIGEDADSSESGGESESESKSDGKGAEETDDEEDAVDDADDAGDEGEEGDAGTDDSSDTSGNADDDDMLNRMMNLLDTHDDKWEESSSADYRYSVTLPDGSVEDVQTKDDVRALLFKHY